MKAWRVVMGLTYFPMLDEFKRLLFSIPTPELCGICFRRCVGTRPQLMLRTPIEVNVCLICVPEVTVPGTHASPWTCHGVDIGGVDHTVIQIVEERARPAWPENQAAQCVWAAFPTLRSFRKWLTGLLCDWRDPT